MKKIIYLLLGVLMFWSCAETYELRDVLEEAKNAPMEIRFDNDFSFPRTKAIFEIADSIKSDTIGVYAKIQGESNITLPASQYGFLIFNDSLTYKEPDLWKCTKRYFWPKLKDNSGYQVVDFYAYCPMNIGVASESKGIVTIPINDIEINKDAKDLIFDRKLGQTYNEINGVSKGARKGYVDFVMRHKMSWISFEAKYTTEFDSIVIDSIMVIADNSTAKFYINTNNTDSTIVAGNTVKADSCLLVNDATPVSHTYKFITDTIEIDSTRYKRVGDFIALPQGVSDNMVAKICYTAKIDSIVYPTVITVKLNSGSLTEAGSHAAPWTVAKWDAGYKYTYRINIKWEEILFTATVTQWADGGTYYLAY